MAKTENGSFTGAGVRYVCFGCSTSFLFLFCVLFAKLVFPELVFSGFVCGVVFKTFVFDGT